MNVLLLQLDGALPNLALMRISAHHKAIGDSVMFRRAHRPREVYPQYNENPDKVYASLIFEKTREAAQVVKAIWSDALIGGTGWDLTTTLEQFHIGLDLDYTLYPRYQHSIGFSQRGCRLNCGFCVVPRKEGKVRGLFTMNDIWRGDPWPRNILLLDNDFFGQPNWRERIAELISGKFKVSFNQGINARFLNDETAQAIASVDYRDGQFKQKRVYTAWDNRGDESRLMRGLELLKKYGVAPGHIMVYMLIGYWPKEVEADWEYRRKALREFGADPYPMPYVRDKKSVGFQRFVVGHYDKRIAWEDFKRANYRPERLN